VRGTTIAFIAVAGLGVVVLATGLRLDARFGCTNDLSAWAVLRSIASAEEEIRNAAKIDVDRDGSGEFGFPGELSGATPLPGCTEAIDAPVLSGAFRTVTPDGRVQRSGYFIRVWLPDAHGDGVAEVGAPPPPPPPPPPPGVWPCCCSGPPRPLRPARAAPTDRVDPKLASKKWCAYAWPATYGRSGSRTFFIDQDGRDLCVDDPRYSGENGPLPGAAFAGGGTLCITGATRDGVRGQDGNVWLPASPRR
jgi:hypothetical protein